MGLCKGLCVGQVAVTSPSPSQQALPGKSATFQGVRCPESASGAGPLTTQARTKVGGKAGTVAKHLQAGAEGWS